MSRAVFWISFFGIAYVYIGYPLLLLLWRWISRQSVDKSDWEPSVSLIIAAYNERDTIEEKILNCLELDYPQEKLQIIVSLDGPTDGTDVLACKYLDQGIHAICAPVHRGKASALNAGMMEAAGEVIVFADARQRLARGAVRELVANFHDQSVGAVTGELIILHQDEGESSDGVGLYWTYEKLLRALESDVHSVAGATGALYAIRREFACPIPEDTILDDVMIPLRAVLAGRRIVYEPGARVFDRCSHPLEVEFSRKTRTLMGNYQLLAYMPEILLPTRNPIFIQFFSHKVGRLLVPYLMGALFISNFFLLDSSLYVAIFGFQSLFYLSACAGYFIARQRPPITQRRSLAVRRRENSI